MFCCVANILIGAIGLLLVLYHYFTKNADYWKKRKITGPEPHFFFGNFKEVILGKIGMAEKIKSVYEAYPEEPIVGLFMLRNPIVMIKDLDLLKEVLIKNFANFADRGIKICEKLDPLSQSLLFLNPKTWKPLRKQLTPVFTSKKLKEMFYLIIECAEHFGEYLRNTAAKNEPMDCREVSAKFTTDVIGVCAFGLNMNALSDEQSEFRNYGRYSFSVNWRNRIRRTVRMFPGWVGRLLAPFVRNDEMINFFKNIVVKTIEYRKNNNVRKNDFIDLLTEIRDNPDKVDGDKMSDLALTAQAFVFFVAGFETSSTTISNAVYEMALNPDVQDKLRDEINAAIERNNGEISYDLVKDMPYLDKVFKETLRMYPAAFALTRRAMDSFTYGKITIPKGTFIQIPIYAIQRDPSLYPNPDKFDPERFDEEAVKARHPMSYLPFGEGPRNCIGERFAVLQSKIGLIYMLRNLRFEVCEKTIVPYQILPNTSVLTPKGGIYLKVTAI